MVAAPRILWSRDFPKSLFFRLKKNVSKKKFILKEEFF